MSYQKRYNQAVERMKTLAKELYEELKNEKIEWKELKKIAWDEAKEQAHFVYGKHEEDIDRKEDIGELGHEERVLLKKKFNKIFHQELKKFPRLTEKNQNVEKVEENTKRIISSTEQIRRMAKIEGITEKEMYEKLKKENKIPQAIVIV